MKPTTVLAFALILFLSCRYEPGLAPIEPASAEAPVDPAYEGEVLAWQARRATSLTSETGWLTLTGLAWLDEGENSLGSAEGSDVPLPTGKAPALAGTMVLEDGVITMHARPDSGITIEGAPAGTVVMKPDITGEPTIAEVGSVQFYAIERGGKKGVRIRDREHEARTSFSGLDYFPIDPSWRVEARLEPYDPPKQIPILNIIGIVEPQPSPGALVFTLDGREFRLDPIVEEGSDDLFVIFSDGTSGVETYPAGRYLYTKMPKPGETTELDFNRSYNPPCAFTEFATCPLPPRQNRLDVRVVAGEKAWEQHS